MYALTRKEVFMKTLGIVAGGLVGFVIVLFWWTSTYNSQMRARQEVNSSWSQVQNVSQRRVDVDPSEIRRKFRLSAVGVFFCLLSTIILAAINRVLGGVAGMISGGLFATYIVGWSLFGIFACAIFGFFVGLIIKDLGGSGVSGSSGFLLDSSSDSGSGSYSGGGGDSGGGEATRSY
jgi:hypothetical protein